MIKALIDGDWILYAAGFAGQRTKCVYVDDGLVYYGDNVTEIKKQVAQVDLEFSTSNLFKRDALDPEAYFYHSAKKMIETQLDKIQNKFGAEVQPIVMMDGDGNFRSRLATIRPYKGQRSANSKPLMYNNLRQYLIDAWDAEVIYDQETDDEMAIRQTEAAAETTRTIIVGVDKDMLQVPGWHLNPNKGFKRISYDEGELRLYVQAAMGDAVDNIAGAYKVGQTAARKAFTLDMTEGEKWHVLVGLYQDSIDKHGDKYGGLTAEKAALENMRLVYLRRERGELWLPPGQRD